MKNIQDYINNCTDLLLEELAKANVIKVINKTEQNKPRKYRLVGLDKSSGMIAKIVSNGPPGIIQDFYDFRNILSNVIRHIKVLSDEVGHNPLLSVVIDKFIEIGVIDPQWHKVQLIRDLFDKAGDILTDESSQKSALQTLKRNKVSFNPLVIKVLEYYTKINLETVFRDGDVVDPRLIQDKKSGSIPDFIVNVPEAKPYLLIEVKFRKQKIVLKDLIDQAVGVLRTYDETTKDKSKYLAIVYTYGQLGEMERAIFNFNEIMERRLTLKKRIFFVPVGISYLENLNNDLHKIKNELLGRKVIKFTFKSQPISDGKPTIDDHFYDKMIDLSKNNLEIRVKAKLGGHWRFGVRFSTQEDSPAKDERHPVKYPLVHLQKEIDSDKISVTYYNESNQGTELSTTILQYKNEELIMKIYTEGNEKIIDILDNSRQRIISNPISVGNQNYCWIFGWADGRNPFEFEAEIIENFRK